MNKFFQSVFFLKLRHTQTRVAAHAHTVLLTRSYLLIGKADRPGECWVKTHPVISSCSATQTHFTDQCPFSFLPALRARAPVHQPICLPEPCMFPFGGTQAGKVGVEWEAGLLPPAWTKRDNCCLSAFHGSCGDCNIYFNLVKILIFGKKKLNFRKNEQLPAIMGVLFILCVNHLVLKIRCKPWKPCVFHYFNKKPPYSQMNIFSLFLTIYLEKSFTL